MGGSDGWLVSPKDYKKENSKTRPRAIPKQRRFEPKAKIIKGNFKAEFVKAKELHSSETSKESEN